MSYAQQHSTLDICNYDEDILIRVEYYVNGHYNQTNVFIKEERYQSLQLDGIDHPVGDYGIPGYDDRPWIIPHAIHIV